MLPGFPREDQGLSFPQLLECWWLTELLSAEGCVLSQLCVPSQGAAHNVTARCSRTKAPSTCLDSRHLGRAVPGVCWGCTVARHRATCPPHEPPAANTSPHVSWKPGLRHTSIHTKYLRNTNVLSSTPVFSSFFCNPFFLPGPKPCIFAWSHLLSLKRHAKILPVVATPSLPVNAVHASLTLVFSEKSGK